MNRRGILIFGLLAVLVLLVASGIAVWQLRQPGSAVGIGGPFTLIDQDGHTRTDQDFRGHYMLVYFGYTSCPDVCPTSLNDMALALDALGPKAKLIQPIFITIDPERDTPEKMKAYVAYFDPRLIGLTGSADQVREAAKAYRVYYAKSKSTAPDGSYLMDHLSIFYLMDPEGRYVTHMSPGSPPETIAKQLRTYVE